MALANVSVADEIEAINKAALQVANELAIIRGWIPSADRAVTAANMIEGQPPSKKRPKRPAFFYVAHTLTAKLIELRDSDTLWPDSADAAWRCYDRAARKGGIVCFGGVTAANRHEGVVMLVDHVLGHFEALGEDIEVIRKQMQECDKVNWGEHVLHDMVPAFDDDKLRAELRQEAAAAFGEIEAEAASGKKQQGRPLSSKTKGIRKLLRQGLTTDAINECTGESAGNIRQIASRMNRET